MDGSLRKRGLSPFLRREGKKKEGRKNPPLFDYLLEYLCLEREAQAELEDSVSVGAGY